MTHRILIDSSKLTPEECGAGVNLAYWTLKAAYHDLKFIQESLRKRKEYELADMVRTTLYRLERGYSYRLGSIEDEDGSNPTIELVATGGKDD